MAARKKTPGELVVVSQWREFLMRVDLVTRGRNRARRQKRRVTVMKNERFKGVFGRDLAVLGGVEATHERSEDRHGTGGAKTEKTNHASR